MLILKGKKGKNLPSKTAVRMFKCVFCILGVHLLCEAHVRPINKHFLSTQDIAASLQSNSQPMILLNVSLLFPIPEPRDQKSLRS